MGSNKLNKSHDTGGSRWNALIVFLFVGLAYTHANLHPTNLPSLILDFPIWLPDEPLGDATGATGWPFCYMNIEPQEEAPYWSIPAIGAHVPMSNRIAFGCNVVFGLMATYIACREYSRAVITDHGIGFILASFLAMTASLTFLLRRSIPLWDELADHLSVALIVASVFAIWETIFAHAGQVVGKLRKQKVRDRRQPRNAVEWYLAGQPYEQQPLSDPPQA